MKRGVISLFILCGISLGTALFLQWQAESRHRTVPEQSVPETNLEIYAWEDERETFEALTAAFMTKYPEIRVNLHFFPTDEYQQSIAIAVNGNQPVDVIAAATLAAMANLIEKQQITALDEMLAASAGDLSGIEEMMDYLRLDGNHYLMPYRNSTWVVYYNRKIFDEAGRDYPQGDWTWTEYARLAAELTDPLKKQFGSINFDITSSWWRIPARTAGASNPLLIGDLALFEEAARWNYDLTYEKQAAMPYRQLTGMSAPNYIDRFLAGEAAMMYGGEWCIPMLNERIARSYPDFSYDVTKLPYWEGEKAYAIGSPAFLMIPEKSDRKENGLLFLQFACGAEGAGVLARMNLLPAWDSEEIRQEFQNNMVMPEHTEYFFSDLEIAQIPPSSDYTAAMNLFHDSIMSYLMGEISLEEAVGNYRQKWQERTEPR